MSDQTRIFTAEQRITDRQLLVARRDPNGAATITIRIDVEADPEDTST